MKLDSIELLNEGFSGIKVIGIETVNKGGTMILIPCTKKYPLPLPDDIMRSIRKLKKYLLEMNNYWTRNFDKYLAQGNIIDIDSSGEDVETDYYRAKMLWESCELSKLFKKHDGYILSGKMKSVTEKFFSVTTPLIQPEDDYDNFSKMQTGIIYCLGKISEFVDDRKLLLMEPVQYAKNLFGEDSEEVERIKNLPAKERHSFMIQTLEAKGYIVMGQDDITITTDESSAEDEKEEEEEDNQADFETDMKLEAMAEEQQDNTQQ